jgi:IS30 family transposase
MAKYKRLTPADRDRILELREEGLSHRCIGEVLDCSHQAVGSVCRRAQRERGAQRTTTSQEAATHAGERRRVAYLQVLGTCALWNSERLSKLEK